jgi:hypothetical protein
MADEFSAELADGVAFVAGHDDDGRPVVVRAHAWTLLPVLSRCALVRVKANRVSDWSSICFSVTGVSNQAGLPKVPLPEIVRTGTHQPLPNLSFFQLARASQRESMLKIFLVRFVRLLVFTLEVAVACMSRFTDQFVLLFDASKPWVLLNLVGTHTKYERTHATRYGPFLFLVVYCPEKKRDGLPCRRSLALCSVSAQRSTGTASVGQTRTCARLAGSVVKATEEASAAPGLSPALSVPVGWH